MKMMTTTLSLAVLAACGAVAHETRNESVAESATPRPAVEQELRGWLSWRGAAQAGRSDETGLFDELTLDGENHAWSYPVSGRGTPVIANGRVFPCLTKPDDTTSFCTTEP